MSTESQMARKRELVEANRGLYRAVKSLEGRLLLINRLARVGYFKRGKALREIIALTTPAKSNGGESK